MKNVSTIMLLMVTCFVYAQKLPSEPANGFSFPIGSKFTIELVSIDSVNYNYSVISYKPYRKIIDIFENEKLFKKKGKDNTIVFYFCLATRGKTKEEKEKNMKVLLVMRNFSKVALNYTSEIQRQEGGEFENTSNVGLHPNAIGTSTEMWPYMIFSIGLSDFKKQE